MQRFAAAAPAGIRFSDYVFSEPVPLSRWWSPRTAGLYAILVPDPSWGPRPFQPVFFGEFGNQSHRPVTQDEYFCWLRAASGKELYVSVFDVAPPRAPDLPRIRGDLIRAYTPLCNRLWSESWSPEDLIRKLEALERRHHEQDTLLRLVLATVGRLLEPAPEPRKRTFGFNVSRSRSATANGK